MKVWEVAVYACLTYEVWAFSFRLAFSDPSLHSLVFIADLTSDSFMMLDCLVQLFEILDSTLKQNDDPVSERRIVLDVLAHQFSSELVGNLLCVGPYYAATISLSAIVESYPQDGEINLQIGSSHWIWWFSTVPRFVVRARRLYKLHSLSKIDLRSNIHTEDGKSIAIFILLSAHCIGCFYFFMSRLRGLDTRTWVFSLEQTLNVYHRFQSPQWEQYLLALFKGFSAISGVEFTSYLANNLEEQLVGMVMILVQIYISALILGTIIHFLALRDPLAQQAADQLRDLREYVQLYQLPPELEARLVREPRAHHLH